MSDISKIKLPGDTEARTVKDSRISTQTAYNQKGSSTKVPQITTNSLGQVTNISEVTIIPEVLVEKTYAQLKAMRDDGTLVAGTQYRITDYTCTTVQAETQSAGHQFDIIVTADSLNKLNENARAVLHSGDTYFANCKLEAWQLKYSIDNDTTKFAWADTTNGKGVIYYMKDEFNNECYYDFKNIQFKRYYVSATTTTSSWVVGQFVGVKDIFANRYYPYNSTIDTSGSSFSPAFYYTFGSYQDQTVQTNNSNFNNTIKPVRRSEPNTNTKIQYLNNISFGVGSRCRDNYFNEDCYSINFYSNFTLISSNKFGYFCCGLIMYAGFNCNFIGNSCSNIIVRFVQNSEIKDSCSFLDFGGYGINHITIGNQCSYISFSDGTNPINYYRYITFEDNCNYIYLTSEDTSASESNYLQNITVHKGVSGSSSSNRLTITVPDRNLAYSTDYYKNNSMEVYL